MITKIKQLNILNSVGITFITNLKSNKILINPPQGAFYQCLNLLIKNLRIPQPYVKQY